MHDDDNSAGSRQKSVNALSSLVHRMPQLKDCFPYSRAALKGWAKKIKPKPATPLTKQLVLALVGTLDKMNERAAGVCLAVSWAGYLRAAKALGLRKDEIALPGDSRLGDISGDAIGVLIQEAKTGPCQFVAIKEGAARHLVESFVKDFSPGPDSEKVFGISYNRYLSVLKKASVRLGIGHLNVTTHSARIGGALYDYLQGNSFGTIALSGRWASPTSVQRYVTNGRALLMTLKFTPAQEKSIADAVNHAEVLIMAAARAAQME